MSRFALLVACVMACYAPTAPQGAPCGPGGECPSGLVCRDGVCTKSGTTGAIDASEHDAPAALSDASGIDGVGADAASDAAADAGSTCPAGYSAIAGQSSQYRTVLTQQTWLAAEMDCEDDGVGTHLAVIDTSAEHSAVDALTGASIWFGLSDRVNETTELWVTGAAPGYTNYGGQGNTQMYDCAGIYQGKWVWGACATPIESVCECDGVAASAAAY